MDTLATSDSRPARAADCASCATWHGYPGYPRLVDALALGHGAEQHRIYNRLWYFGIKTTAQLDRLEDSDLRNIPGIGPHAVQMIRAHYAPATSGGDEPVVLRRAAAATKDGPQPWAAALAAAFAAAAESYDYCQRINARDPGRVPELPDPAAEELARVARIMLEPAPADESRTTAPGEGGRR